MVKSEIMHLLFTPKGQRLRSPNFGSRLIQFIFNPNDQDTWTDIVSEFKDMVKQWVPYCQIKEDPVKMTLLHSGIHVVVDGPYIESLRRIDIPFRGSSNQKIWTVRMDGSYREMKDYEFDNSNCYY